MQHGTYIGIDGVELNTDLTNDKENPYFKYLKIFARNHGISLEEAVNRPMCKARLDFFNRTGK